MARQKDITVAQLLEAIENSQGIISTIQAHLKQILNRNISWHAVDNAIRNSPEATKAVEDEKQKVLDICENKVIKEIVNGDVHTAKWYLKMKGRERGYEESVRHDLGDGDPLNINLGGSMMSAKENLEAGNVEIPDYGSTEEDN